jgi:NAD(P)-dependent dehydrogenase (short-subunit alcohol dehydrogenase family)
MQDLAGKVAVVTGGAGGLGRAMAESFGAQGMKIVLADIEQEALDVTAGQLKADGVEVTAVVTDVSDHGQIERLADSAWQAYGGAHVLCNNAGVVKGARTWALTRDDWTWVLGVDLWSVIYATEAFVPRMLEQNQGGHIVNTASMAGLLPVANLGPYNVAKAGVIALSEGLHMDLSAEHSDIGVSVLCPGFIKTGITESGRNRPASLAETAAPRTSARTTAGVQSTMSAAQVAQLVVDAVRTKRFWIVTHDRYHPIIRERAEGICTGDAPVPPPVF